MQTYKAADKQVTAVFGRFSKGLMNQESVPDRAIQYSIEDVRESFALYLFFSESESSRGRG